MLDPLQYSFQVLCNGMKTRFRMIMIAHPGRGIGFHKRFMWWIIILTMDGVTQKGNSAGGCDVVARASRMEGRPRVVPECPRAQRRGEGVTGMEKCWSGKKDVK